MKYELAKKLKDAGFPNSSEWHELHTNDRQDLMIYGDDNIPPSLSELIQAVKGDKPNSFYLEFNDEWSVYEKPNPEGIWKCRYYDLTPVGFYETFGSSPEEAVANLWLGMNEE